MSNLKVLIVEGDAIHALELKTELMRMGHDVLGVVHDVTTALKVIFTHNPDLILMDVYMNGQPSGLQLGQRLINHNIPIIFITAHTNENIYQSAKKINTAAYLVKPFDYLTLRSAIDNTIRRSEIPHNAINGYSTSRSSEIESMAKESIFVKHNNNLRRIAFNEINFIQSEGNYSIIHTTERKYAVKISLRRIQLELPDSQFAQIHQRYVVPIQKISNIELSTAKVFLGEDILPLGRTYKSDLLDRFRYLK